MKSRVRMAKPSPKTPARIESQSSTFKIERNCRYHVGTERPKAEEKSSLAQKCMVLFRQRCQKGKKTRRKPQLTSIASRFIYDTSQHRSCQLANGDEAKDLEASVRQSTLLNPRRQTYGTNRLSQILRPNSIKHQGQPNSPNNRSADTLQYTGNGQDSDILAQKQEQSSQQ